MGHLNELQDKYAAQGFTVLAVTDEERGKVDAYVEANKATHPIVIESSNSMQAFGGGGFPSSYLIAPDGTIAWSGHPASVPEDLLEELLTKATLFKDLPKALASIGKSIGKSKLNDALKALAKQKASGKLDRDGIAWAEKLQTWLDWNRNSVAKRAEKAEDKSDFYSAWKAYTSAARDWKGGDFGKEAAAKAKALLGDKEKKVEIDAGKRLAKITRRLGDGSPKKAIKALGPMVSKKYVNTKAGQQAADLIKGFERELQRIKGG